MFFNKKSFPECFICWIFYSFICALRAIFFGLFYKNIKLFHQFCGPNSASPLFFCSDVGGRAALGVPEERRERTRQSEGRRFDEVLETLLAWGGRASGEGLETLLARGVLHRAGTVERGVARMLHPCGERWLPHPRLCFAHAFASPAPLLHPRLCSTHAFASPTPLLNTHVYPKRKTRCR